MSESLEKVVGITQKLTDNNDNISRLLESNKAGKFKHSTERRPILIIVKCNEDNRFENNTGTNNDMVNLKKEIEFLKENQKFQRVLGYYYEYNKFQDYDIKNLEDFTTTYKFGYCDITFCGLYGNTCVIKSLLLIANELSNKNNNYYFSFMGTRFLPDDLFATQIPSPCNIYSSFKNSNSKEIVKVEESIPQGKSFDNNIQNHKYWIGKNIETLNLKNKDKIKIKILDYKGNPIFEPNSTKQLEVDIELPSNSIDAQANLKVKKKPGSIDGKANFKVKEKLGSIFGFPNFRKSTKPTGGKNRKTRKIKAKNTQKIRVKKPRKRSLR